VQSNNLREARLSHELSQNELANLVGVTARKIQHYEEGLSIPSEKVLVRLAETLDATSEYLLGLVDDPHGHLFYDNFPPPERKFTNAFHVPERRLVLEFLTHMTGYLIEGDEEPLTTSMLIPNALLLS
jgi:transcriptional regulator with XRE-family HTH domain